MASILHNRRNGTRAIQFTAPDGRRPVVRLGKVSRKIAEAARGMIEALAAARRTGTALDGAAAAWVAGLPDVLRRRIEAAGLIGARDGHNIPTLGEWLSAYVAMRGDVKAGTRVVYGQTVRNLKEFFGVDRPLDEVTPGDATEFQAWLETHEQLSVSTSRRRCGIAKQFFRFALKKRVLTENPFADAKTGDVPNEAKYHFVSADDAQAVLDACPDAEWRLLFSLARFGGLRCPSEVLALRWQDVDWARQRFTVTSTKTEHVGKGQRLVPIFPELAPHLQAGFDAAEEGAVYCITRYRDPKVNLRTQLAKIIRRAGLLPWPKPWQNMRSTRETELIERFPVHAVCKWLGNTRAVAQRHYLQVTDAHFAAASGPAEKVARIPARIPAQQAPARGGVEPQETAAGAGDPAFCGALRGIAGGCNISTNADVGCTGFEPVTSRV